MTPNERCGATLVFGDDYGDNDCTMHCQLAPSHEGQHEEQGDMGDYGGKYVIRWHIDGRIAEQADQEDYDRWLEEDHNG